MPDPLDSFSAPVRDWFLTTYGQPTSPQALGWPPIQRGEHALILAPTGSGKTLAAFLWGIDVLFREESARATVALPEERRKTSSRRRSPTEGVHLLYVSPLKALNNDIERNLRSPLEGIRASAVGMNIPWPALRVSVRTGDTPASARAAMTRNPPHILITTPESLYLMLTSPRAREMFRTVRMVIVDEIHTLCGNKRGVHLSLSLERLQHLAAGPVQRVGLSATIKPLQEAARFLVGQAPREQTPATAEDSTSPPLAPRPSLLAPRPVTIVDAGYQKPLDLKVITVVEDFRSLPGETVWPAVVPMVLNDIRQHHTTLVFCNNRRLAERTADRLNAQFSAEQSEEIEPGSTEALAPHGLTRDRGIFAIGAEGIFRAHHGSMSRQARRQMEEDLKAGRLPALVGTSSLELGIDIGAVDLVVQLQSPKSVAQGLQRVGRSGHLVGETSVGRIYATFREDLVEAAAIARGMLDSDVEPTWTPQIPLDVLAQQIVAMVACEEWSVDALYNLVRQAYAYRDLTRETYYLVLEMLSGKYGGKGAQSPVALRARISWDRVNNRLAALPGTRLLAMLNAGTISDTGAFGVYLGDNKTRVGDLDEEFIFETRVGDAFLLGSHTWRVREIKDDRVIVEDAAGATPRMPFWNGDYPWRPYELGSRIGRFRGEVARRIAGMKSPAEIENWLQREYALDDKSARNLIAHVQHQLEAAGVIASDTTVVVESFLDAIGEPRWVIHSPFGGRVNGAWALALSSALRERFGAEVETQTNDDGMLFRFPRTEGPAPLEVLRGMTAEEARRRILEELPGSAVFGAHFRMNAARALLLPKMRGAKRTPFWLQRLKAKDLLAAVKGFDDFPIVAETYRDCLRDVFDLPHLEEVLSRIQRGEIQLVPVETIVPSPVASGLLFNFANVYMYEWDAPKAEKQLQALSLRREVLEDLLQGVDLRGLIKPEAIVEMTSRAQHNAPGYQARSAEELAVILRDLGDLTAQEVLARCAGDGEAWLTNLAAQNRVVEMQIPTRRGLDVRWVPAELADEYRAAFGVAKSFSEFDQAAEQVLRRLLFSSMALTRGAILDRHMFPESWLEQTLARLVESREIVRGHFTPAADADEYCDARNLERVHRRTLTLLRKEVQPVSLYAYSDFLAHWQHLTVRLSGAEGLQQVLEQFRGVALAGVLWDREVLPARLADFRAGDLDARCQSGDLVWAMGRGRVRFFFRGEGGLFLGPPDESSLSADARKIIAFLGSEGASFTADLAALVDPSRLSPALIELVQAGLITNDTVEAMRAALEPTRRTASADQSELETELASRLGNSPRPLTRARYYDAKRRVARRLRVGAVQGNPKLPRDAAGAVTVQGQVWQGRWSLVHRLGILGQPLDDDERADRLAQVLLARYGIVTRQHLEREEIGGEWGPLYSTMQRMEMRGEIRRGYFVEGLGGAQFALPDAVERLRALVVHQHESAERDQDSTQQLSVDPSGADRQLFHVAALGQPPEPTTARADDLLIVINAADPADVFGAESGDTPHWARVPSTHLVLWRGRPILVAEENGERLTAAQDVDADLVQRALAAYVARPHPPRHTLVERWNGADVLGSPGEAMLHNLGFYRTPKGMEK